MTESIPGPGSDKKNPVMDIFEEARKEVLDETRDNAKRRVKTKMKELVAAERVVANIRREIQELKLTVAQDLENV